MNFYNPNGQEKYYSSNITSNQHQNSNDAWNEEP